MPVQLVVAQIATQEQDAESLRWSQHAVVSLCVAFVVDGNRLFACVWVHVWANVLHSHHEKNRQKKKRQHTIWYVIMYKSVLVLFEFG